MQKTLQYNNKNGYPKENPTTWYYTGMDGTKFSCSNPNINAILANMAGQAVPVNVKDAPTPKGNWVILALANPVPVNPQPATPTPVTNEIKQGYKNPEGMLECNAMTNATNLIIKLVDTAQIKGLDKALSAVPLTYQIVLRTMKQKIEVEEAVIAAVLLTK